MPLVSGVCRTASAPMLSHGGSRLNASKPEANPKTRYPYNTQPSQHPSSAVVCSNDLSLLTVVNYELFLAMTNLFGIRVKALRSGNSFVKSGILVKQVSDRIASQTIAARAASVAPSISHNHKWLLLIASFSDSTSCSERHASLHPKAAKANTQPFPIPTSLSKRENMHWLA